MICSATCIRCLVDRQEEKIRKWPDEQRKRAYMQEVTALIGESGEEDTAPYLAYRFRELYRRYDGASKDEQFRAVKTEYNQLVLGMEDDLRQKIREAQDPLARAFRYARIGNYIDFSAMEHVDRGQFLGMFEQEKEVFRPEEAQSYAEFLEDCAQAAHFVLLADNCGEIVLDKLFLQELAARFPSLEITVLVRGEEIVNDATMEDAQEVGLTRLFPVLGNGSPVAGTQERSLSPEALAVLNQAEVVLAKGQGNFETLYGSGRNVYYSFLCKCRLFSERFAVPQFTGMFVHERMKV